MKGSRRSIRARRRIVNSAGLALIVAASLALIPANTSSAYAFSDTCEAGNGASCSGSVCCADADECYTGQENCDRLFCTNNPKAPECVQ